MDIFVQNLINGVSLGSVYALIALGYTMVYGVLQFINFAHSEIFMLGAFVALYVASLVLGIESTVIQLVLVLVGTMTLCTLIGLTVERIAYRPLRKAPRLNVLITAIGVSIFLQNLGIVLFGANPQFFPSIVETTPLFAKGQMVISNVQVIVILVACVLMVVLHWLIAHTKLGMAMRAVSQDMETSSLMGIPTDRIIGITFVIGSSLAGCAAVLYGLSYPKVEPLMGMLIGIKAFVAAVLGGIGNIMGAAIGGLIIGLAESFVTFYISSSMRDAIAFGILILILLLRPAGLFGTPRQEKV